MDDLDKHISERCEESPGFQAMIEDAELRRAQDGGIITGVQSLVDELSWVTSLLEESIEYVGDTSCTDGGWCVWCDYCSTKRHSPDCKGVAAVSASRRLLDRLAGPE